jgi:hypothetical protein
VALHPPRPFLGEGDRGGEGDKAGQFLQCSTPAGNNGTSVECLGKLEERRRYHAGDGSNSVFDSGLLSRLLDEDVVPYQFLTSIKAVVSKLLFGLSVAACRQSIA